MKTVSPQSIRSASPTAPQEALYQMPAEWQRHEATWLVWPHNKITWPGKRLKRVETIYLEMIEALLSGEKVNLLVQNEKEGEKVLRLLRARRVTTTQLILHEIPTVDTWIRDYGPTFIKKYSPPSQARQASCGRFDSKHAAAEEGDEKAWRKWIFNAWGGKYADLATDNQIFIQHAARIQAKCFRENFVLEGGSIEVNGEGTCVTTEQCLLNPNRNPHLSKSDLEAHLKRTLGVTQVLWMGEGIVGDDTDGHIDDIIRFVNADTILCALEEDPQDENYPMLKENWQRLKQSRTPSGRKWNLVPLPMPGVVGDVQGRLPASYANFYIANEVVLLPIYSHLQNDKRATAIFKEYFPKRRVVAIESTDLVYGMGSIHCVTQQEPA